MVLLNQFWGKWGSGRYLFNAISFNSPVLGGCWELDLVSPFLFFFFALEREKALMEGFFFRDGSILILKRLRGILSHWRRRKGEECFGRCLHRIRTLIWTPILNP